MLYSYTVSTLLPSFTTDTNQTEHDHGPKVPLTSLSGDPNTIELTEVPHPSPSLPSTSLPSTFPTNVYQQTTSHPHKDHRHISSKTPKSSGHDLGMMGVMIHVIGDAINNIGVIIAAAVIWKADYGGRFYADPGVSMGIAFMILLSALPLGMSSSSSHNLLPSPQLPTPKSHTQNPGTK